MPNLKLNNGRTGVFKRQLIRSPKVSIGASSYGYGVFCISPILKGEIIEECVLLSDRLSPNNNELNNYVFRGIEVAHNVFDKVIPAGIGPLVNHNIQNQNIDIEQNPNYERILTIFALKDIYPGQELFWNYGYQPK